LACHKLIFDGSSNDLAWDGESKRIIAVGDGRERYGHAFMFDTGSSTGEIIGHAKVCSFTALFPSMMHMKSLRQSMPYQSVTSVHSGQPLLEMMHKSYSITVTWNVAQSWCVLMIHRGTLQV
jgi:hypothetical protein